ncbi:hypothetical protein [Nitrosococcus oceani]|uniref:hypothetical protein n=1 Tax=Nitrosococcus oceani TaxID=1229 RepID=UPI000A460A88|nr:hypothetical protein [Nitrosococcus oceani]
METPVRLLDWLHWWRGQGEFVSRLVGIESNPVASRTPRVGHSHHGPLSLWVGPV